jgi:hypothetical protein
MTVQHHRGLWRGIIGLAAATPLLGGCVASEKAAYLTHLTATVEPGPGVTDDVAVAFHLDGYAPAAVVASAAVPPATRMP